MSIRIILAILYLILQLVLLVNAQFGSGNYFHWAPFDSQNEYWITVQKDGRFLSSSEIFARYRKPAKGIDFHAIEHILAVVQQYEQTQGKNDFASVLIRYRVNGGPTMLWQWPKD